MNKLIMLFFLCSMQFLNAECIQRISECYSYHTPHFYNVFTQNNRVIFQHTVKDPNGISYVSRENIVLDSINSKGFNMVAEDADKILFSTIDGYFIIEKNQHEAKNYGATKVAKNNEITETVGTNLIRKNGRWYLISPQSYSNEIVEKEVKNVPENLEIYQTGIVREGPLMRNEEAVYIFDEKKLTFRKIPNLTGKNTRFFPIQRHVYEGFIYDDDTFYFIAFDDLIDYTEEFTSQNEFTTLKNAEIIKHQYEYSINTNDGIIWLYLRFKIDNEQGKRMKITPVKATYLGKNKDYVFYKGKAYNDFSDLLRNYESIDISIIENPTELETRDYIFYNDGINSYIYDYDERKFKLLKGLPGSFDYYPSIDTYNYMNSSFYDGNNQIYYLENPTKISKLINHSSAIKDLKLAYAYDDKMLIENREIKNIGDRESMEFIGSKVNVISDCDGGHGQYPVEIDVYYFFKDNNGVYVYNSTNPKMRQLENQNPSEVKIDNYDYLMQLMKVL